MGKSFSHKYALVCGDLSHKIPTKYNDVCEHDADIQPFALELMTNIIIVIFEFQSSFPMWIGGQAFKFEYIRNGIHNPHRFMLLSFQPPFNILI